MAIYGSMVLAGYFLQKAHAPALITLGILVADGSAFAFVYLLLAFPSGRLSSRADWLILGPVLFVFGPLELVWLAFLDVPGNVFLVSADAEVADAVDWIQRIVLTCADAALVAVLVTRWRRASPPMRRALAPVLAGAAAITTGTVALVRDKIAGERTELIAWILAFTFVALPVALLANLLRMRLARTAVGELLVDLHRDGRPSHLQDALRTRSATRRWRSACTGCPSTRPAPTSPASRARAAPRRAPGRRDRRCSSGATAQRVAALLHDPSLARARAPELRDAAAAAAAIALENARLQADAARAASTTCAARAHASSRRATPSAGGSSATSTTARSSAS